MRTSQPEECAISFFHSSGDTTAGVGGPGYANPTIYFAVSPNDSVHALAYACDSAGNAVTGGAYGCFLLEDFTTQTYLSCSSPSGACPSLAVINTGSSVARSAEVIAERGGTIPNLPQHTNFTASYTAYGYQGSQAIRFLNSNDASNITDWTLIDRTSGRTLESAAVDYSGQTATFSWSNYN